MGMPMRKPVHRDWLSRVVLEDCEHVQRGAVLIILLCGGDKSTQASDIKAAHRMLPHLDTE
ncbi:hypothetical protein RO07_25635 [Pandoraea pulmonicola]|uniref:Addiction module killer protein n=1 Tax=Pandoraea pulmonicola TaxID=93221 RepID=A0ABN4UAP7_PANPU|nr:hypothetical protein RO07_25635 [Pandoraea pulmonicola]